MHGRSNVGPRYGRLTRYERRETEKWAAAESPRAVVARSARAAWKSMETRCVVQLPGMTCRVCEAGAFSLHVRAGGEFTGGRNTRKIGWLACRRLRSGSLRNVVAARQSAGSNWTAVTHPMALFDDWGSDFAAVRRMWGTRVLAADPAIATRLTLSRFTIWRRAHSRVRASRWTFRDR